MHCLKLFQYSFLLFIDYEFETALARSPDSTSLKILFKNSFLVNSVVLVTVCKQVSKQVSNSQCYLSVSRAVLAFGN